MTLIETIAHQACGDSHLSNAGRQKSERCATSRIWKFNAYARLPKAHETLTRHRPRMLIEIEQRHSPTPILDTFEYLKNLGFRGEFLDSFGRTRDIAGFDLVANQSAPLNPVGSGSYINNFIFRPL